MKNGADMLLRWAQILDEGAAEVIALLDAQDLHISYS